MALREIVLASVLGISALVGCRQEPKAVLEPIAVALSTERDYVIEDARNLVYLMADTNDDARVSYSEAKAMVERCQESTSYNCN